MREFGKGIAMPNRTMVSNNWIVDQNIARFAQKLRQETDPAKRRVLTELLDLERSRRASRSIPER
ncbi:MAG: hypothetical protein V4459_07080 [Pseudomonadota bacterium]